MMKKDKDNLEQTLYARMQRFAEPSASQLHDSRERVRQRLLLQDRTPLDNRLPDVARAKRRDTVRRWSLAAAGLLLVVVSAAKLIYDGMSFARVESEQRSLYLVNEGAPQVLGRGDRIWQSQTIRSDETAGGQFVLSDESQVEMRSQSELLLERADDGLRIRLSRGSIIINAVKRRRGHLYVQTNDVTVSVVGTVFVVNAEAQGSRVAVIEGEVHVQQGATEKRLLPGQQVATGPLMESRSVSEEISWSRSAETHLALLQQSTELSGQAEKKRLQFEAASIKASPPANGPIGSASPECRGIDGVIGEKAAIPLGRCIGDHVSLRWLVVVAYGLSSPDGRSVEGLPDWGDQPRRNGFQIEAKAADPATTTKEDLRQMLQTLLADRFKLKVSQEKREVQGFVLSVLTNKLPTASTEEPFLVRHSEVPGDNTQIIITGKGSMEAFSVALADTLIYGPVLDKTELGGMYDFNLTATYPVGRAQPGPGGQRGTGIGGGPETSAMVSAVRSALQSQLGLRLEIGKVPEAFVVIEHVERPSED